MFLALLLEYAASLAFFLINLISRHLTIKNKNFIHIDFINSHIDKNLSVYKIVVKTFWFYKISTYVQTKNFNAIYFTFFYYGFKVFNKEFNVFKQKQKKFCSLIFSLVFWLNALKNYNSYGLGELKNFIYISV
uniref:Uncharacterized protein n=1 Tax=Oxytricha trifallax TaxID=1172189 RepID=G9HRJ7_9SPIT|nr:hypothetical protein [Oxytricha trifallax]